MKMLVDRKPRFGQKTPTAYRCWVLDGDVYLEYYLDDRDVAELGYEKAITMARETLMDVYYR